MHPLTEVNRDSFKLMQISMHLRSFLILVPLAQLSAKPLTLSDAVTEALRSRDSIKAAMSRVYAAEANRSAEGVPARFRAEFGGGTAPDVGTGNDFLLALPLDVFGKSTASRSAANALVLAAKANLKQAQLDLQSDVLDAYAAAVSAQTLLETGQSLAEIAQTSYAATQKRIASGDLPPAQLLRADLELERANQALSMRRQNLIAAKIRLGAITGMPVVQIQKLDATVPDAPDVPRLAERPDLLSFKADIASAKAEAKVATASRWPDLEFQFSRAPFDTPEQYNARLQFVLPLYDYGASREKLRSAHLTQAAAEHTYRDRLATAQSEIQASRVELDAAKAATAGYDKLVNDAKGLISKEQRGFTMGASTLLDVLETTRALRDIEESASDARSKWIQAEGHYLSAIGALLVAGN